eukprot:3217462-Prorocentrum_lima.AAC.1
MFGVNLARFQNAVVLMSIQMACVRILFMLDADVFKLTCLHLGVIAIVILQDGQEQHMLFLLIHP